MPAVKKQVKKKVATKKRAVKKRVTKKAAPKKRSPPKRKSKAETLDEYGLSFQQREFADLYRGGDDEVRGNAKRSYWRVYPKAKESTAETEGAKLLRKPQIHTYLRMRSDIITERSDVNAQWLLDRLAQEANADIADLYDENGALKPVHMWPEVWRRGLVTGLDVQQEYIYEGGEKVPDGYVLKVKMAGRDKKLEMIGRHVNVRAFKDTVEHTGSIEVTKIERTVVKAANTDS